jgi:hypothetical protein
MIIIIYFILISVQFTISEAIYRLTLGFVINNSDSLSITVKFTLSVLELELIFIYLSPDLQQFEKVPNILVSRFKMIFPPV